MKEQTACFTGHRDMSMPLGEVKRRLNEVIDYLISKGVYYFGNGGALGFDTISCMAVIEAKQKNPKVKLILVLPCKDQDKRWKPEDRATYSYLKTQADKIVHTSENYHPGCMHKRNRHLVDNSKYCIAFCERQSGGTAYTVDYAQQKNLVLYNLAQKDFLVPVEYDNHP